MASKFDHFGFAHYNAKFNVAMYPPDPGDTIFDGLPPGWEDLLLKFCEKVVALFEYYHMDANKDFHVEQIKEKFGALRVYYAPTKNRRLNEKIDQLLANLEAASSKLCAVCGQPATCTSKGWILPYCTKCAIEWNNAANARHKTDFSVYEAFTFPKKSV